MSVRVTRCPSFYFLAISLPLRAVFLYFLTLALEMAGVPFFFKGAAELHLEAVKLPSVPEALYLSWFDGCAIFGRMAFAEVGCWHVL